MNTLYFDIVPGKLLRFVLAAIALYLLFLFGLDRVGMLKEDEPRYVAIGQAMAASGDWITPRLWGDPWFEKPPLLYWMVAAGFRAGLPPELAARYPIALASVGFLIFFWVTLRREFGERVAWYASAMLATTSGWLSYSHVAVTDLPMAAAFSAAMLLALPALRNPASPISGRRLVSIGLLMGIAVLGKVLVPAVLALPLMWHVRKSLRDLSVVIGIALVIALPWYIMCFVINGTPFFNELIIRQMLARMVSGEREHVQPFFYYVPILLAGLFPWTLCISTIYRRSLYVDLRLRFLLTWAVWGLVFFSLSVNKLPGYLLPLLPAIAVLFGVALSELKRPVFSLTGTAVLVATIPLAVAIMPDGLDGGLTSASLPDFSLSWAASGLCLAIVVYIAVRRELRDWAVGGLTVAVVAAAVWIKLVSFPMLDERISARGVWRTHGPEIGEACEEYISRSKVYGLSFYAGKAIPNCTETAKPLVLVPDEEGSGFQIERR
jgi:4-amino-4-deoxy-L-arabinose transferase-like glycosyltransferase